MTYTNLAPVRPLGDSLQRENPDFAWFMIPAVICYTPLENRLYRNGCTNVGDILLFTKSEWPEKPNMTTRLVRELESWLGGVGLQLSDDDHESVVSRVTRIYGSVENAPASALLALAKLPYPRKYVKGALNAASFRWFLEELSVTTIGEAADIPTDSYEMQSAAGTAGTHEAINKLAELLEALGWPARERVHALPA
jgi:hypothetical protein